MTRWSWLVLEYMGGYVVFLWIYGRIIASFMREDE